jgi:COMPASS component SPP1
MEISSLLDSQYPAVGELSVDSQPDVVDAPVQDSLGFGAEQELAQIAEQATESIARGDNPATDGSQEGAQSLTTGQLQESADNASIVKPKPKKSTTKDEGMHSDKRYLCYLCNKLFTRRRSVRDHISKIHNIKTWDPTRSLEIIVDPTSGECVEPLEEQIAKAGQVPADVTPPPPLPAPPLKVTKVKTEPSLAGSRASSVDQSSAAAASTPGVPASTISKKRPAQATKDKKGMARIKSASAAGSTPNKKIKLSESESITGTTTRSPSATPASARMKTPLSKLARQSSQSVASSPTPSSRSRSASVVPSEGGNEASTPGTNDDGDIFCICRKGDNHTWMIACDGGCEEWYHGNCVNIRERDGDLIDKYICPRCTRSDYTTTWKRMCRRKACRKPARVLDVPPSKYCSPECGRKFFVEMVQRSDPYAKASNNGQYIVESAPVKKLRKKMRKLNLPRANVLKELPDNMDGALSREDTPMLDTPHKHEEQSEYETDTSLDDDELPNRGSTLRAGEVKVIVDRRRTIDEWRELGRRPIDPPVKVEGESKIELDESEKENQAVISKLRNICRERISVLESREQLLEMIKIRSAGITDDVRKTDKKNKELCGFDPRLSWTEEEFLLWRNSDEGKAAIAANRIGQPPEPEDGDASDTDDSEDVLPTKGGVCIKGRCQRHRTWQKAQLAEIRFEQDLVRRKMEKLEREEADVMERAVLRAWERWDA